MSIKSKSESDKRCPWCNNSKDITKQMVKNGKGVLVLRVYCPCGFEWEPAWEANN